MTQYFEIPTKLKVYSVLSKLYNDNEDIRDINPEELFDTFRAGKLRPDVTLRYLREVFKEYASGNHLPLIGLSSMTRSRKVIIPGMTIMFLDTETSGLSSSDRVIQLAYIIKYYNGDICEELFRYSEYVDVDVSIHWAAAKVHGITKNVLNEYGKCPQQVYREFDRMSNICNTIVAFNSSFDYRMMKNSIPADITLDSCKWVCAMKAAKNKGLPGKLNDIYKNITGGYIENAHDALADVLAMITVYEHIGNL